jgi:hypothetical protein
MHRYVWGALSDEDIGEACRLARQVLEAEHDDAGTIGQAAQSLFVLAGDAAMAAAALERAIARNPNAALAWSAKGISMRCATSLRRRSQPSNGRAA